MKASRLTPALLSVTAVLIAVVIGLVPFHAFLTVWAASNFGHYTAWRLWKELLLAVIVFGALVMVLTERRLRQTLGRHPLIWVIAAYLLLQLVCGLWAWRTGAVTPKALLYGWLVDSRFLVFFVSVWVVASRYVRLKQHWRGLLLWPAVVVVVFGLLQITVLPTDFLSHFGYSSRTIFPYETINHNLNYVRIMSSLRGANPLGAYLLIPISCLLVLLATGKRSWQRLTLLAGALVTLFFSYSRSAWAGAVLSGAAVGGAQLKRRHLPRWWGWALSVVVVVLAGLVIGLRHDAQVQNVLLHSQAHTTARSSSDQGHASALKKGLHDLVNQPLGRGPGTAGPASVYNGQHTSRIAENYFIQIGQEVGWLGLALFLAINVFLGWILWQRRTDALSLTLLASLVGLSLVNLLSHAWTDDTLGYVWWGLAGIAIGALPVKAIVHENPAN